MSNGKQAVKIIRDPICDYIALDEDELRIVDSPYFQRLRYIRQNSTAYLTYPGAGGVTRFDHGLGVMYRAHQIIRAALNSVRGTDLLKDFISQCQNLLKIKEKGDRAVQRICKIVRIAALCHDLGHFPFSHASEEAVRRPDFFKKIYPDLAWKQLPRNFALHEWVTLEMLKGNLGKELFMDQKLRSQVIELMSLEDDSPIHALREVVSSEIDADRVDYILRDGTTSGSDFGNFDVNRLLNSMRLCKQGDIFRIRPTEQALSAIESFFMERLKIFKWLYFHHHVVFTDYLLVKAIRFLLDFSAGGDKEIKKLAEKETKLSDYIKELALLLPLERFDWKHFLDKGIYFDDTFVLSALWKAFGILQQAKQNIKHGLPNSWSATYSFLEMLLQRKKTGIPLWKYKQPFFEFNNSVEEKCDELAGQQDHAVVKDVFRKWAESKKIEGLPANIIVGKYFDKFQALKRFEVRMSRKTSNASYEFLLASKCFAPYKIPEPGESFQEDFSILVKEKGEWKLMDLSDISKTVKVLNDIWQEEMHCFAFIVFHNGAELTKDQDLVDMSVKESSENLAYELAKLWYLDYSRKKQKRKRKRSTAPQRNM